MILKTLPLDISSIKFRPEIFITQIDGEICRFEFSYNSDDHKFYVSIYDDLTNKAYIEGKRLVYGQNLLPTTITDCVIIPLDFSGENYEITYGNLTESVKLYLITGDINA